MVKKISKEENVQMSSESFNDLKGNPSKFIKDNDIETLIRILKDADLAYYTEGSPEFSDDLYDQIKEGVKEKAPNHKYFKEVGADVLKEKEELPVYMGSMDKIKGDDGINKHNAKYTNSKIVSDKLDGISGLFMVQNGERKLYTRGNGYFGQNISKFISSISDFPKDMDNVMVRGELIMSKNDFDGMKGEFSNPRNLVAGLMNSKKVDQNTIKKIRFVAYSLISPKMDPIEQLQFLESKKFNVVHYKLIDEPSKIDASYLSQHLNQRRKDSLYEIDGLVIQDNKHYPIVKGKNPASAFAFKNTISDNIVTVIVNEVEWNINKDGLIKPVVKFDPVSLNGVKIQRATGFNGYFIKTNGIGPGAKIMITRSGDVIPHIMETIVKVTPQFPAYDYVWGEKGKEIMLKDKDASEEVKIKILINFFKKFKVRGLSSGNLQKMYKEGYKTPIDVIKANKGDFMQVLGKVNGEKVHSELHNELGTLDCIDLMSATNFFDGLGKKRLQAIMNVIPEIKSWKTVPKLQDITSIDGFSKITAENFINGLVKFNEYMKNNKGLKCKIDNEPDEKDKNNNEPMDTDESQPPRQCLKDQVIIFTGFRDPALEKLVEKNGGKMVSSISNKTTMLVAKSLDKETGKIKDAKDKGIKMITLDGFKALLC